MKIKMINHPNLEDQRAEGNEGRPSDFVDDLSFGQKLRMTWRGQNDFGRIGGTVLDIAESFLPKYVSQTRNLLQKTTNTMDKPKLKSKSIQGVVGLLITVILQVLGVDVTGDPELMNDIYHILYGLSGFWSVFGLRDALGKVITKQESE